MATTPRSELLDAVDALTLTTRTKVVQVHDDDTANTVWVVHEPLLTQLETAISSTIGAGAGRSMTEKWALSVLDSDALYQFTLIANTVREWCRLAGLPKPTHPVDGLRAWYTTTLARRDFAEDWYVAQLRAWAATITAKLTPTRNIELTAACPACGADTWTDADGAVYRHPIRISYRDQDADILGTARAICRACETIWTGSQELRALRYDVDEKEGQTA